MEGTQISFEEVRSSAEKIVEYSNRINDIFDSFKRQIGLITEDNTFRGIASNEYQAKALELSGKFNNYIATVVKFSRELNLAHDKYQELENYLAKAAGDLKG